MKKDNVLLKVSNTLDFLSDEGSEANMSVTAWNKKEGYMLDEHIIEKFPELGTKFDLYSELEEVCEGDLLYHGDMTIDEMVETLRGLGFEVEIFTGTEFENG